MKKDILKNYYQNILFNDIVPRFDIKKSQFAEKLLYYLLSNVASPFSYSSLSRVVSLADKTVKDYVNYFAQSLILFSVDRFSPSVVRQISSPKKAYSIDNGLINAIAFKISDNLGPLFENIIAVELLRREMKFFYYIASNQKEVDFIVPHSKTPLIQVSYRMSKEKTRKQEITALRSVVKETGVKDSLLITLDEEEEIRNNGLHITVTPAWKFLALSS